MIRSFLFLFLVSTAFGETPAQFAALKAQVLALQQQVIALQQNKALALAPFVNVDLNPDNHVSGPNITFHGANIHIVNGLNATQLINGLGNLIIGYDEYAPQGNTYQGYERSGSHNLVLGRYHKWFSSAFGNLMAGEWNVTSTEGSFIAGYQNEASGLNSSVLGGQHCVINTGTYSVILGGENILQSGNWQILPRNTPIFVLSLLLVGCASGSPDTANSFDGHNFPTVGQTKAQVLTVWGILASQRSNMFSGEASLQ
jgi:hypothetical protein